MWLPIYKSHFIIIESKIYISFLKLINQFRKERDTYRNLFTFFVLIVVEIVINNKRSIKQKKNTKNNALRKVIEKLKNKAQKYLYYLVAKSIE